MATSTSEECQEPLVTDAALEKLQIAVEQLYHFRDFFFESHSIDEAYRKNDLLKEKMDETLQLFTELKGQADKSDKARYLFLLGRTLNVMSDVNTEAEECLSKALKLNPGLVNAWNELGECFWKRGKTRDAMNCFENALSHARNRVSLRSLSITYRDEASRAKTTEERRRLVELGVKVAKEAVAHDFDDGTSWAILANAHLSEFFNVAQNPLFLKSALAAYAWAEKDPITRSTAEFHYNKAITLKYDEDYKQALEAFSVACSLDPTWESAAQKLEDLIIYLGKIHELVEKKGKVGGKKLQGMLKNLSPDLLGPYKEQFKDLNMTLCPLTELTPGCVNKGKVVLGRVVCHVRHDDGVPFLFCMTDKQQNTVAVSVYNLAEGKGVIIGDAVAIPEPYFFQKHVSHKDKEYSFGSVRVNSPMMLVVNGKKLGQDCEAGITLSTFNKPD
ncbi:tetratricopeptide repeat protein 5 [Frankliniella occidentalis]|uniref:Tetratricopeptide repeat protein 5 n=1 Tax=Frankliniella occidentalis TaxID=133901 RepID=A0A6J1S2R5_FRAOC|nr:tetratricopeptide repeat protein 5 [Frankliniella occidentalis]